MPTNALPPSTDGRRGLGHEKKPLNIGVFA